MNLPFTQDQFFEVFAAYNNAVWPLQIFLNLAAVILVALVFKWPERAGRPAAFGLFALWSWLALGYHWAFFSAVNPAAPMFAGLSLIAAALFLWFGVVRAAMQFKPGLSGRKVVGLLVVVYALLGYPAIGFLQGHHYPAAPTFGLPCPTTIFTFGILLMASPPLPRAVVVAPTLWAMIGAAAAFLLGVPQDLALVAMVFVGAYLIANDDPPAHLSHTAEGPDGPRPQLETLNSLKCGGGTMLVNRATRKAKAPNERQSRIVRGDVKLKAKLLHLHFLRNGRP